MVSVSEFIENWPSSGGLWSKVRSGSGIPSIKLKALLATIVGGAGLAWAYGAIGFVRRSATHAGTLVADVTDYFDTVLTKVTRTPGLEFLEAASNAATAVGNEGLLGYAFAFGLTMAMVTVVWAAFRGVRKYVM